MDPTIRRVPDAPHGHLRAPVRTDLRGPSRALRIPLPRGQAGNDRARPLDHAYHACQHRWDDPLDLGKRLGGLHPSIADTLAPLGQHVLPHPADKRVHRDGFVLPARGPMER
jgi:hypothetical protein